MTSSYWPVAGLRLETRRLVLRPATELDLPLLADLVPADAEPDPARPRHFVDDRRVDRALALYQSYWSSLANWYADQWRLGFVVMVEEELVGLQELEASDFRRRRVVETGSWLTTAARGRGIGKEMRAAVLQLAFGGLGALEAESGAWWDNAASLGVSWALGYRPNGEYIHVDGDKRDRMTRARLVAADWARIAPDFPTSITGLEECRHLFGVM